MKEAVIVGLDGFYKEPVIVGDEESGVFEVLETQESLDFEGNFTYTDVLIGHRISVPVPEGLYLPKWDSLAEAWIEGKPQAEIDAIKQAPESLSIEQQLSDLQDAFNAFLGGV